VRPLTARNSRAVVLPRLPEEGSRRENDGRGVTGIRICLVATDIEIDARRVRCPDGEYRSPWVDVAHREYLHRRRRWRAWAAAGIRRWRRRSRAPSVDAIPILVVVHPTRSHSAHYGLLIVHNLHDAGVRSRRHECHDEKQGNDRVPVAHVSRPSQARRYLRKTSQICRKLRTPESSRTL